jgi:hypothetical protein
LANPVLENYDGFKTQLNFAKTSGKYRYFIKGGYISENYDVNDLGIIFLNNYHVGYAEMSYRIINPTKVFNSFKATQNINIDIQNTTGKFQEAWYHATVKATTLKNELLLFDLQINPLDRFDFYQARQYGRYVYIPKSVYSYAAYLSDWTKTLTYGVDFFIEKFDEENRKTYTLNADTKYRFNNKLSLGYEFSYTHKINDRGWVDSVNNDIIFAERNREILEHVFTGKYSINNKMNFNLIVRYYSAYSENHDFFTIKDDGNLTPNLTYLQNKNRNLNSWNFDLSYSWWFAPGSELSILYRNYALDPTETVEKNIKTNFKNVFNANLTNIFSVSLRYYIDYNSLKSKH